MTEYDYRIELGDKVVETNDMRLAAHLVKQHLGEPIDEERLEELCQAWERRSSSTAHTVEARATYCDAAEKLRAVLNGSPWTESP